MSTTPISIRPFAPADALRLERILTDAFVPVFASFRAIVGREIAAVALANAEAEQRSLLASLCEPTPDSKAFVATRDGDVVGFACVKLDRAQTMGEVVLDAVAPTEAGRGAGTALVKHALAFMRAEGMRVAVVGVGGDESHAPARRTYAKAGFRVGIPSIHMYQTL
ncbi:MAG: GNAT family N-acetyltransferase [Alphaproteobacteria bacterium]|nr:GNAT family N-acetyltransferase [Alphaproteobacteria bacterium]